ncbi:MAG: hypothetical protein F6K11_34760 [Leptolyngbya sp. SIO3F4]|nr:hypothetical protein [Leptolyngbya sp. SIO3F4]
MLKVNPTPLKGIMLAGYARANADAEIVVVAQKCGYRGNVECFSEALTSACASIGIQDEKLSQLIDKKHQARELRLSSTMTSCLIDWRKYIKY